MANIVCYKFLCKDEKPIKVIEKKYLTVEEYNELIKKKDYETLKNYTAITDKSIEWLFFNEEIERELTRQLKMEV